MAANPAPPMSQFGGAGNNVGGAITTNRQGVALTNVSPQELTSYQLGQLQTSGNPLVQQAQQTAQAMALARGGGLGGTQVGDAATRAAFASMTPIAQADAGQYASVRDANQAAINAEGLQSLQNQGQIGAASAGANATMYAARLNAQTQAGNQQLTRDQMAQQQHQFETGHQYDLENQANAQHNYVTDTILNGTMGTIYSDPAFWSNPEAALNMANTFSQGFDQIFNQGNGGQAFANP